MTQVKKSIRPIPLTYRGKKRYILFELIADKSLDGRDVEIAVRENFLALLGEAGFARAKLWFILFNSQENSCIIRCANEYCEEVKAGLLFMKEVKGGRVIPKILSVSGSIKKLKERERKQ